MKRFFLTLAVASSLLVLSSFKDKDSSTAKKDNISYAVNRSFTSNFNNAENLKWSRTDNYYRASFTFHGEYLTAFFANDGRMLGVSRNISPVQLPIPLQSTLKKGYDNYWISDVLEFDNEDGTTYYVTLENADTQVTLKSASDVDWSLYKKQRKS